MAEQKRVKRSNQEDSQTQTQNVEDTNEETQTTLSDDLDGLLDEIDDVLEVNAEEFIKNYVQKGGQ